MYRRLPKEDVDSFIKKQKTWPLEVTFWNWRRPDVDVVKMTKLEHEEREMTAALRRKNKLALGV